MLPGIKAYTLKSVFYTHIFLSRPTVSLFSRLKAALSTKCSFKAVNMWRFYAGMRIVVDVAAAGSATD